MKPCQHPELTNLVFLGGRLDRVYALDWCPHCGAICETVYGLQPSVRWRLVAPAFEAPHLIAPSSSTAPRAKQHARAAATKRGHARKRRRAS